ncbi:MAG: Riboflavin transporter [Holosporales bacterium]
MIKNILIFQWFFRPGYIQGVFWANMISVFSVMNDVLMCHLGNRISTFEITFFRFFFCTLMLLPLVLKNIKVLKTNSVKMHFSRIIIGAIALWLCCLSVNCMPLSQNTAIMFTQPLFFLPMAFIFLKEKIGKQRWISSIIGFLGLIYIVQPHTNDFQLLSLIPMGAAILFAILDIVTKKMVVGEKTLALLFYFGIGTTFLMLPFSIYHWITPNINELLWLFLLGFGGNMIQVCLFFAFSATEASALAPFRYVEFVISITFGYFFFSQIPTLHTLLGSAVIIVSSLYLYYIETHKKY